MPKEILIFADAIENDYGPTRPALLVAKGLALKGFKVTVISPYIERDFVLKKIPRNVNIVSLGMKLPLGGGSFEWLADWFMQRLFNFFSERIGNNLREVFDVLVNFSSIPLPAFNAWYVSGTPYVTILNIIRNGRDSKIFNLLARIALPLAKHTDIDKLGKYPQIVVANSRYTSRIYSRFYGLNVDRVIYPPLDTSTFKPPTDRASEDYILTYYGKETHLAPIVRLAKRGVRIKMFGGKMPTMLSKLHLKGLKIEFYHDIGEEELTQLYRKAYFTLFSFTDEPFGYIPVESMACGTPVLTYNRQGPGETVIHNETGWLVDDIESMVHLAYKLYERGYDEKEMSRKCVERAQTYSLENVTKEWCKVIEQIESSAVHGFG